MDGITALSSNGTLATALFLLGTTPALLAGLLTRGAPSGREISGVIERDQLVFSQYSVQLGEVPPTGTIPAHFDFFNVGDSPIEILELIPSCGCLAPRLYEQKQVYEPGEHGRFYVSVKTANETPGPKNYNVNVKYNDGEVKEKLVTFRLTIPEKKVSISPAEVYFYQRPGEADHSQIVLEDFRGKDLHILSVVSSTEYARVSVGQRSLVDGVSRTPIRIDVPADVPHERHVGMVIIETDDPEYDVIRVPILIWGSEAVVQQASASKDAEKSFREEKSKTNTAEFQTIRQSPNSQAITPIRRQENRQDLRRQSETATDPVPDE